MLHVIASGDHCSAFFHHLLLRNEKDDPQVYGCLGGVPRGGEGGRGEVSPSLDGVSKWVYNTESASTPLPPSSNTPQEPVL